MGTITVRFYAFLKHSELKGGRIEGLHEFEINDDMSDDDINHMLNDELGEWLMYHTMAGWEVIKGDIDE